MQKAKTRPLLQGSAQDIWKEVHHLKTIPTAVNNRTARQSGYDQAVEEAPQGGSCDGCCIPGEWVLGFGRGFEAAVLGPPGAKG